MKRIKNLYLGMNPKQWIPYLVAVVLFLLMTLIYVSPVLEGKRLVQSDIIKWQGMSKEIADHRESTGEEALWTNSMFGGMPAFQISVIYSNNISSFFHRLMTLGLPRPADMVFLYFAGFFIFLLLLQVNPWIALAGAIGFAFSSYHFIILEAGHNSKAVAIAYMAPVMGAIVYTFRGKLLSGGILFAIFMGLQLFANHFQITYYLGIIIVFYGIFELVRHIEEKKIVVFLRTTGVLLGGLVLAIGLNIGNFWSTYNYTSETMRGGSELSIGEEQTTSGLSKEYITNWSYGISETYSLLIPNAKGGSSGALGNNPRAMSHVTPGFESIIERENQYWGNQPITSGPVYLGVVVLFFFFLSLFYLKGPLKWALLIATILSIMLAWGKNFMPLTEFFIDYVPGYNKFRAVSMTLVIAEFCIPALAFMGLHKLYHKPELISVKSKPFLTALGLTAGVSLVYYLSPGSFFNFLSKMEASAFQGLSDDPVMSRQINLFIAELERVRMVIFKADAMRSFLFALGAAGITWLYASKKLTPTAFIVLLIFLVTVDMWPVNRRYLNNDDFVSRRRAETPFPVRAVDNFILEDKDPNYRVLDLTESTFNSSRTSYYHHSIGGYHGAKLQRYQDLIDFHISENIMKIANMLRQTEDPDNIPLLLRDMPVLNMLNTRYLIYNPESLPIMNESALGNAWFVEDVHMVNSADEEIQALQDFDPSTTAVVNRDFAGYLQGKTFESDTVATVTLEQAQPNLLIYRYNASKEQLLVFSEIFYPRDWKVSIDGQQADHFRVNYILRAMVVPAGDHEVTFSFEPRSYYAGNMVSLTFSIILVLLILSSVTIYLYKSRL